MDTLPNNGCSCNQVWVKSGRRGDRDLDESQRDEIDEPHQKKGCINALKWLQTAFEQEQFVFYSNYTMYRGICLQNE